jgi:hypothetical protein
MNQSESSSQHSKGRGNRQKNQRRPRNRSNPKVPSGESSPKLKANQHRPSGKTQAIPLPTFEKGIIHSSPGKDFAQYRSKQPSRRYQVMFFDSFQEAKAAVDRIKTASAHCDQLNLVIKAEGSMDDPELLGIDPKVKVFAGEAWHLIHTRRLEEKWYDSPHE